MTNTLSLVQTVGQTAFTTSLIVAKGCDNKSHESTIKLIRRYQTQLEQFGLLDFKSESSGGRQTEYAILNEDQATFLVTLFRNTPTVVAFKVNLVKEFRRALDRIAEGFANPPRTGLSQEKRLSHWDMTGALKEAREEAGKDTEAKHFMCENKLCNSCITGKYAKLDEATLDNDQLVILKKVRIKNAAYIRADMEYAERKVKLHAYAERLRTLKLVA